MTGRFDPTVPSSASDPRGIVVRLMGGVAPGSYLVISHPASDIRAAAMAEMTRRVNPRLAPARGTMRSHAETASFFARLTLLQPHGVQPPQWQPGRPGAQADATAGCGGARKR